MNIHTIGSDFNSPILHTDENNKMIITQDGNVDVYNKKPFSDNDKRQEFIKQKSALNFMENNSPKKFDNEKQVEIPKQKSYQIVRTNDLKTHKLNKGNI